MGDQEASSPQLPAAMTAWYLIGRYRFQHASCFCWASSSLPVPSLQARKDRLSRAFWSKAFPSSGDKFRRPSPGEAFFDILTDKVVFKPLSLMGFALTPLRSALSFVREVIPGINRRGVSFKLPRKGTGTSLED